MKVLLLIFVLIANFAFSQIEATREAYCEYEESEILFQLCSGFSLGNTEIISSKDSALFNFPEIKALFLGNQIIKVSQEFKILSQKHNKIARIYRATLAGHINPGNLITKLETLPYVAFSEKIPHFRSFVTPNDPDYLDSSKRWHLDKINASNAWLTSQGCSNIKIAVVDDAVLINHEDLVSNIFTNSGEIPGNGVDDDGNGYIDDIHGFDVADNDNNPSPPNTVTSSYFSHGTHVSGIAAGSTNNGVGISSIGYNTSIIPVKCKSNSSTSPTSITNPMQGVEYAISSGADVINMSWGSYSYSYAYEQVFEYAESIGINCVAAAGNDAIPFIAYPANYPNVISVMATNASDYVANFSNFTIYPNPYNIYAPGVNIWSPIATGVNNYGFMSGTSMSTPLVSGVVALMLCNDTTFQPNQIRSCLYGSADLILSTPLSGHTIPRLNAFASLLCPPPIQNQCETTSCELIQNGNLETPADNSITEYTVSAISYNQLCGWEGHPTSSDCYPLAVDSSNHFIHLQALIFPTGEVYEGAITKLPLNLFSGQTYSLDFDYCVGKSSSSDSITDHLDSIAVKLVDNNWVQTPTTYTIQDETILIYSIQDAPLDFIFPPLWNTSGAYIPDTVWHHVSTSFIAPNDLNIRKLAFHPVSDYPGLGMPGKMSLCLDNISVQPVVQIDALSSNYAPSTNDCITLTALTSSSQLIWEPSHLFSDPYNPIQIICLDTMNVCQGGQLTFTATALDSVTLCSVTDSVILNIQGIDTVAPIPNVTPLPDYYSCGPIEYIPSPTATDNCSGALLGVSNVMFPIASDTSIIWTYTDSNGNDTTQVQNIIIGPLDITTSIVDSSIIANQYGAQYQWINCEDDSIVPGAIYQSFTPSVMGNYAVILSSGSCTDTSGCFLVEIKENYVDYPINIYPNPSPGVITISHSDSKLTEVKVYTLFSKLVYERPFINESSITMDLSFLSKGSYILEINTPKGKHIEHLIIQ